MELDDIDKKLLNIIQVEFPLAQEPYSLLGESLGISTIEVADRIKKMKAAGIIRLIGPVLNPYRLGYRTTLVAVKISYANLDEANRLIIQNAMVSHCYQRNHDFNLWFTLATPITEDMDAVIRKLANSIKAEKAINLPALRTFKIEALFGVAGAHPSMLKSKGSRTAFPDDKEISLSNVDRLVINALPEDLPLNERPFDFIALNLEMSTDEFLNYCRNLLQQGIMRRFSAAVNHSRLGFTANAMTCWQVPQDKVDNAGGKIASFDEVSHCYERGTNSLWPYNLFAMVHADNRENCLAIIDRIGIQASLRKNEKTLLFSTEEVKKTRVKYSV